MTEAKTAALALTLNCSLCGAPAGTPCYSSDRKLHVARWKAAMAKGSGLMAFDMKIKLEVSLWRLRVWLVAMWLARPFVGSRRVARMTCARLPRLTFMRIRGGRWQSIPGIASFQVESGPVRRT